MKEITINYTINTGKEDEQHNSVTLNAPEDFNELGEVWGKGVGYDKAMAQIIIDGRRICVSAESTEEAQEFMNTWTPGSKGMKKSKSGMSKKALLAALMEMKEEDIKNLLASFKTQ